MCVCSWAREQNVPSVKITDSQNCWGLLRNWMKALHPLPVQKAKCCLTYPSIKSSIDKWMHTCSWQCALRCETVVFCRLTQETRIVHGGDWSQTVDRQILLIKIPSFPVSYWQSLYKISDHLDDHRVSDHGVGEHHSLCHEFDTENIDHERRSIRPPHLPAIGKRPICNILF